MFSRDSQPLSPVIPMFAQWVHEKRVHGSRNGDYTWTPNLDFSEADLIISTAVKCFTCWQQRPRLRPAEASCLGIFDSFRHGGDSDWFSLGRTCILDIDLPPLPSVGTTIHGFWNSSCTMKVLLQYCFPVRNSFHCRRSTAGVACPWNSVVLAYAP